MNYGKQSKILVIARLQILHNLESSINVRKFLEFCLGDKGDNLLIKIHLKARSSILQDYFYISGIVMLLFSSQY